MRKPFYQQLIITRGRVAAGIVLYTGLKVRSGNSTDNLTIRTAAIPAAISGLLYLIPAILSRYRKIKWITNHNKVGITRQYCML